MIVMFVLHNILHVQFNYNSKKVMIVRKIDACLVVQNIRSGKASQIHKLKNK